MNLTHELIRQVESDLASPAVPAAGQLSLPKTLSDDESDRVDGYQCPGSPWDELEFHRDGNAPAPLIARFVLSAQTGGHGG